MTRPSAQLPALLAGLADAAGPVECADAGAVLNPLRPGQAGPEITDIVMASDEATPGCLFVCVKGAKADGHEHAADAVERGAVALLVERHLPLPVAQVVVASTRRAVGPLAATLWGNPSKAMRVVGVTGTNGKTTTCALLASVFDAQGWPAGVIGTLTGARTTPEAPALQRRLAELRDQGCLAVAMEVSSHALEQYRPSGTHFAAAVFTNLSQDHLDYHGTMEAYFEAKAQLFTPAYTDLAVVNRADPWGAKLAQRLGGGSLAVVTFGPEDASQVVLGRRRSSFTWAGQRLEVALGGRFNVLNALAAATAARQLGVSWDALAQGLASVPVVKGRFQRVDEGQPFDVIVDFAHTPAALAEALRAAREQVGALSPGGAGRVMVVFGAGGDRDRGKRPLLGQVASQLADVVVVTSDNPRSEQPVAIAQEVLAGMEGAEPPVVELDRAEAIKGALAMARPGDVVLVAGKGHETGQDFGDHVEPFDDAEVARAALARLMAAGTGGGRR